MIAPCEVVIDDVVPIGYAMHGNNMYVKPPFMPFVAVALSSSCG